MSKRRKPTRIARLLRSNARLQPLVLPVLVLAVIFGLVASRIMTLSFAAPEVYPNPQIGQTCGGLDIALVADVSGSITNDRTEFTQMQTAFTDFVSSLPAGTGTKFSLTQFDGSATVLQNFTTNTAALVNSINNFSGGGDTNWVAGLQDGYGTFSSLPSPAPGAKPVPKLLIIATDGDPTRPRDTALSDAITEANVIKQAGIHIMAIGLGSSPTISNLEAITGTNLNTGDINADVVTTNFSTLDAAMLNIASATCGGSGNGTGTGGTGNGDNGAGSGTGGTGSGSGTGGTGTGSNGTGNGNGDSATPQPNSSPLPAPVPDPNTHPITVPTIVPNPQPSTAPVPTPSPTPNPAPAPKSQGNQTKPPEQSPSVFFDGKLFAPGSAPDNAAAAVARAGFNWWYVVIGLMVALAGGGGYLFWQRRQAKPGAKPKP